MPGIQSRPLSGGPAGSKYRDLLTRLLAGTSADSAILGIDGEPLLVESRRPNSEVALPPSDQMPWAPFRARLITDPAIGGVWPRWCRERLITSAAISPVMDGTRRVGSIVLASTNGMSVSRVDLSAVVLAAWMAGHAYEADRHLLDLRRELSHFEPALQVGIKAGAGRNSRAGFRELARAMGSSLDATYCRLASMEDGGAIRIHAAAGRRAASQHQGEAADDAAPPALC